MKAIVNRDTCIGCGLCESTCPNIFVMDEESIAKVLVETVPQQFEACTQKAKDECPVDAISIE